MKNSYLDTFVIILMYLKCLNIVDHTYNKTKLYYFCVIY